MRTTILTHHDWVSKNLLVDRDLLLFSMWCQHQNLQIRDHQMLQPAMLHSFEELSYFCRSTSFDFGLSKKYCGPTRHQHIICTGSLLGHVLWAIHGQCTEYYNDPFEYHLPALVMPYKTCTSAMRMWLQLSQSRYLITICSLT